MQNLILPLSVVVLSILLIATLIRESLVRNELLKFRLSLALILTFSTIAISAFYNVIVEKWGYLTLSYICSAFIVIIGLLMFNSLFLSIREKRIREAYFHCVESNNYFVYLNKRHKIKNISKSFARFLGMDKNDVIGKTFTTLLSERYSNLIINNNDYTADNIKNIFNNISSSKNDLRFEIKCLDVRGREIFLNLIDRPIYSTNNKFIAHIIYGQSKGSEDVDKTETQLNEKSTALEMNKLRFRALLEEGNEPLFFLNLASNSIWANDSLIEKLGFSGNSISFEEYKKRIYPDDLAYYMETIEGLTISHPQYDIKYRFKKDYDYVYVHERGKKVFGPESEIVSVIEKIRASSYEKTGLNVLDDLHTEEDLYDALASFDDNIPYEIVCLKLNNIRDINEQFGRRTGNIAMNDYIRAIMSAFVDDGLMFRTSGLEFFFIIKDFKKMESLKHHLEAGKILDVGAVYGSNKVKVEASMGIVNNHKYKDPKSLVKFAKMAVELTKGKQKRYSFYE